MSSETDSDLARQITELQADVARLTEKLRVSEKSRVEYLQNVAHQLVAPLNAIKWHVENITSNRVTVERAKKVLRSIYSQATIAVHLAKNFALMSNLEADHSLASMRDPLEPLALSGLLVNLADDFQPLGWDKGIHIDVSSGQLDPLPEVLVIKPLIGQVFSNIIENAVKYSNNDTRITVGGKYHGPHDVVVISIANTGIPIPDEDCERIFERTYRTAAAKNRHPAGTGFGLYIAKRIIEIHEGDIEASTDGGNTTVFEVTLPVGALAGKAKQWPRKK